MDFMERKKDFVTFCKIIKAVEISNEGFSLKTHIGISCIILNKVTVRLVH